MSSYHFIYSSKNMNEKCTRGISKLMYFYGLHYKYENKGTKYFHDLFSTTMEVSSEANETNQENVELTKEFLKGETVENLLGKPTWHQEALPEASFTTLAQFECALAGWARVIQQHLTEHDFNSIGNYVQFYRDYRFAIANKKKHNPIDFYRDYEAKINPKHMTCTGLTLTLLESLQELNREHGSYFVMLSSEEKIDIEPKLGKNYNLKSVNIVKGHVLLCLKFSLSQCDRKGCVLIDSGYSLTHPIVVMKDRVYPHTGWFVPFRIGVTKVEQRHYKFLNNRFIQYESLHINLTTGQHEPMNQTNLIYTEKPYLSYVTNLQKRSFLIKIKYWVIRNRNGIVASFYSLIDKRNLTILYKPKNLPTMKHDFSIDQLDSVQVQQALRKVAECSVASRSANDNDQSSDETTIEHNFQAYLQTLREFRKALDDERFTRDIVALDDCILSKKQKIDSSLC